MTADTPKRTLNPLPKRLRKNDPELQASLPLKDVPLFKGLSLEELRIIKPYLREKTFQKGEIIFFEGDACERIVILQSGRIKVFRTAGSGREQILEILEPGDTCACNPGNTEWSCSSSAQALTPGKFWIFPRENYVRLIKNNTNLTLTLNHLFAKRLCRFSALIQQVSLRDTKKRLVQFLIDMHQNSVSKRDSAHNIYIPFTREEIAQRLGTTRETVVRHLQQLKRHKLIEIKPQQVIILDKQKLNKLLD